MSMNDATTPSSSADRARLYRERKSEGVIVVPVEVGPDIAKALTSNFLLDPQDSANRREIGEVIELLLYVLRENAIEIDWDRWD